MPWVVDDAYGCVSGNSGAHDTGRFTNPVFPSEVAPDESWEGTITVENLAEVEDRFRVMKDGEVVETFALGPRESRAVRISGVGPQEFTLTLERWAAVPVGVMGRILEWAKRHPGILMGSAVVVGAVVYKMKE